jgi:hypothetical protein
VRGCCARSIGSRSEDKNSTKEKKERKEAHMSNGNFDPQMDPAYFIGEFTKVNVIDPASPPIMVGNFVIDPTKEFKIELEWKLSGFFVPVYLGALADNWTVEAYAMSLGPPLDNRMIASLSVPKGAAGPEPRIFSATLTVPANTLREHVPGPAGPCGIYRLTFSVFLDSTLGLPGYDIIGFYDGPTIRAEKPD